MSPFSNVLKFGNSNLGMHSPVVRFSRVIGSLPPRAQGSSDLLGQRTTPTCEGGCKAIGKKGTPEPYQQAHVHKNNKLIAPGTLKLKFSGHTVADMGGVQFIATCCYDTSYNARAQKGTKTVIMVHGIAACALQNKIKPGTDAGCYLPCCREPGWNLAWASFEAIVTGPELLRNTLELEQVEGRLKDGRKVFVTKDQDGVEVRPYPGLDGIATINPGEEVMIPVLYELIDKLVDQYRLQPANYDWRKWGDLSFMESYKESLAKQVEEEFAQTQQPVSLIGHSMGCSVLLYVLTVMGSNWQQQYLDKVIFITPVVMGCPKGCSAFAHNPVGIISGLGTLPEGIENYWKQAVVASPATGCLLPLPVGDVQAFPDESHIVVTPKRGYAAHQIPEFIFDLKGALGPDAARFDFFPYARETAARLEPPAVPTHLIYGRNMHTINQLTFKTEDFQDIPEVTDYVSGDGTVTAASVEKLHKAWVGKGAQIFLHGAPESVADEHLTIVSSEWLLGVVPELLKD